MNEHVRIKQQVITTLWQSCVKRVQGPSNTTEKKNMCDNLNNVIMCYMYIPDEEM